LHRSLENEKDLILMSIENLQDIRPIYFLPKDDLAGEVLIPAFCEAENVDCMMGFFSSGALAALAPGLATFINKSTGTLRLIVSPFLSPEDRNAIESGLKSRDEVLQNSIFETLITENDIQKYTLECLSHLIHQERLAFKVALMKDALFHPKVWLFHQSDNVLGVHGSSNMTGAGIIRNFEQISVAQSWSDAIQKQISYLLNDQFVRLWNEAEDDCIVLPISQAIEEKLLQDYLTSEPPIEDDYLKLYEQYEKKVRSESTENLNFSYVKPTFKIPDWLNYKEGTFSHQGKAVDAWVNNDYNGILEMATGSGKTITAMICAHRLYESKKPLLVVVAAPYLPLIEQWCGEIEIFGIEPTNLTKLSGSKKRSKELQKIRRKLRSRISDVEVVVVSHNTLCSEDFHDSVLKFPCSKMLIADEAHNLGRNEFIKNPPKFFEYRLALSATPERQYDRDGTDALFDFFGPSVFQFTLQEAIGTCLVEYDYYVHPVYLTEEEMDRWYELTESIRKNAWQKNSKEPSSYLEKLFRDRRKLLETAKNKIQALASLLEQEDVNDLRYALIYATDKDPEQLKDINQLLIKKRLLFHQLTAEETTDREKCQDIIKNFQTGEIQVLTAKRVLDEGVNIPQINKAFVLASTTVERQWIQRRGRLLRTCKETDKTHSTIHDFVALPAGYDQINLDDDAKKLVKSELKRIQEFAGAARNAGRDDGPLALIDKMVNAVYL